MPSRVIFRRVAKRAALFFAALVLPPAMLGDRVGAAEKTDSERDLIERAYSLSTQHERAHAMALLVGAASKKELRKSTIPKELLLTLEEVANVFYSDKAQQLYELGLSLKSSDPALALVKLNEALKLEPDNLSIQTETVRLQIGLGDCSSALNQSEKILETDPFSENIKLHHAQAAVCSGRFDLYTASAPADLKKANLAPFWQITEVEMLFKKAEHTKALDQLVLLEKANPKNPEVDYWRWKILAELKSDNENYAQKYVLGCRKLTPRQVRELSPDPNLCRHTTEVENFLKKTHNPGA